MGCYYRIKSLPLQQTTKTTADRKIIQKRSQVVSNSRKVILLHARSHVAKETNEALELECEFFPHPAYAKPPHYPF